MLCAKSNRIRGFAALAVFTVLFAFSEPKAKADPPTAIPAGGPPGRDLNAIEYNGWQIYPSINFLAESSNNFFISPLSKIAGWKFVVSPAATAEWSNGIHTTTVYGNVARAEWPTNNELNGTDAEGTFTQRYAPLRDLNFTLAGDYTHQTVQSSLTSSIPSSIAFTGTTVLPNGNISLPNGTIVSPSGQVVGQVAPTVTATPASFVNPYDQYTGTASVQKIFSHGILTLGAALARTNYVNAGTPNFTNKTFREDGSFWLGSIFYFYSDGSFNINTPGAGLRPKLQLNGIQTYWRNRYAPIWAVSCFGLFWTAGIELVWVLRGRQRLRREADL